jgi:DinB superfamily
MTTTPERYADLADLMGGDDPALARLVGHLDRSLQARPAPPRVRAALEAALRQHIAALQTSQQAGPRAVDTLSRRDALKAGAASMAWLLTLGHIGPATARELAHLAQEGPMTGARLAGILQAERAQWRALLAQVGMHRMEEPGVDGTWSLKELVAHLTWYERVVVEGAQQVLGTGKYARVRSGLAALEMDERNARIAAESRPRPVGDVLAEAEQTFSQLLTLVAACPEDILNDPRRLGLPDDVVPWMLVANNSYAHFRQHAQAVQAWLDRTSRDEA